MSIDLHKINEKIILLGKYGGLSKGLMEMQNQNNIIEFDGEIFSGNQFKEEINSYKVATYCPTLRDDSKESYLKEIDYYDKLSKSIKSNEHLIYISSITVELTNVTFYSQAKAMVEKIISSNTNNYTILRLGMIYDQKKSRYTLASMDKSSKSLFTFFMDIPKTTACTIEDIYKSIFKIACNIDRYSGQVINIGIKRHTFFELQNIALKKHFRIPVLSFFLLKFLSIFSKRLEAYVGGNSLCDSPKIAFKSSFD